MKTSIFFCVIDSEPRLMHLLQALEGASWVAVDTEADSLHAYPEKLCLIQVSTEGGDYLVDPLAEIDLDPFLRALAPRELIMHGADYDLRLFRKHHEFTPTSIFDTMLAARLIGIREFSLGNLVEHYLGVRLEKGAQKANWAMRPLTRIMEVYARNDTHYLKPLSDRLTEELVAKGRLEWQREACARLVTESASGTASDPDSVWRIRGSQVLDRQGLAILRELWRWREKEAIAANRPPFFVLSHEVMVALAAAASSNGAFSNILPKHLSERRRHGIEKVISHAKMLASEHLPKPLRHANRRPSEGEKRRCGELRKRRDTEASRLGIDPTLIASRSVLANLAHDWDQHLPELMAWQRALLLPQP